MYFTWFNVLLTTVEISKNNLGACMSEPYFISSNCDSIRIDPLRTGAHINSSIKMSVMVTAMVDDNSYHPPQSIEIWLTQEACKKLSDVLLAASDLELIKMLGA